MLRGKKIDDRKKIINNTYGHEERINMNRYRENVFIILIFILSITNVKRLLKKNKRKRRRKKFHSVNI